MERRRFLKAFGVLTTLTLLPHEAQSAWARVVAGVRPVNGLTATQLALIGAIADTILPRTDSPSATDVGVPAFVDVVVSENYSDADRDAFVAGLAVIEARLQSGGTAFVDLPPDNRGAAIETLEQSSDRRADPARTYWRLKGLVVHGFFTSEPIMKTVLHFEVMPGAYNGSAPMPVLSHG
jgi:hypothetical protein